MLQMSSAGPNLSLRYQTPSGHGTGHVDDEGLVSIGQVLDLYTCTYYAVRSRVSALLHHLGAALP